jgi:ParB family transcriptional regulator, chromosome partitioning protein
VPIKIEEIHLSEFDLSLSGFRIMNLSRIEQIEKSMRLHGQLQPVVARMNEGRCQIIDGFKRVYIAMDLMIETLQCQLLEVDEQQAKVLLLSYNRTNQSLEVWEEAMVLKDLLETHDLNQQSLARLTGYSRSWVSRRLSLISRIDEQVASNIRMGALSSSHGRALMRLPRGNQSDVADVIITWSLSSRLSDRFVDAFLEAEDENQQRYILAHPEHILWNRTDLSEDPYDSRLSSYGNDLMHSVMRLYQPLHALLSHLGEGHIDALSKTEKEIITPFLKEVFGYAEKLSKAIGPLHIHQKTAQNER